MATGHLAACVAAGVAVLSGVAAASDVIAEWNQHLLSSVVATSQGPPLAARTMAMTHLAMFEAVNSVDRGYAPYRGYHQTPAGTSKEAAAAQAARDVLAAAYPSRVATFDAHLATSLAGVPDGPGKAAGIDLGRRAATGMLAQRAADGATTSMPVTPGTLPGQWRPTAPAYLPGAFAQMASCTPFGLSSPSQFRPAAPPSVASATYAASLEQVRRLGSATSTERTAEQTDIARVWAFGAGTITPPGAWNRIAQQVATSRGMGIDESARMFALLGMAQADAAISAWECKNTFGFWRPITAIREADADGNDATAGDAAWLPVLTTPNFQSYTSGHSTFSSAAAAVLRAVTGSDAATFSVESMGIVRTFTSLSEAAQEAGMSRVYGGIHFDFDNTEGLSCGSAVGEWAAANFLQVPAPGVAMAAGVAGLWSLSRRRRR